MLPTLSCFLRDTSAGRALSQSEAAYLLEKIAPTVRPDSPNINMYMHIYVYAYMHMYMYVHTHIYIYIYVNK